MKSYVLAVTLSLFIIQSSPGRIKNGYQTEITGARESLKRIRYLLEQDNHLSIFQRMSMKSKIKDLTEFITYHNLTEKLLTQFKTISPDLYFEIDSLTDRNGKSTDVFVKFVPEKEMPPGVAGTTNIGQDKNDPDAYHSEYGIHTVSVRIVLGRKSLNLLAHELGHAKYQVQNLAAYLDFYTKFYLANTYKSKGIGHNDNDPSGQQARAFTYRFNQKYINFLRLDNRKTERTPSLSQVD